MNTLFKYILLISVISFLSACAGAGSKKVLELPSDQKILVVSAMGDDFEAILIGMTLFTNKKNTLAVEDWNIDEFVEKTVEELAQGSRFKIKSESGLDDSEIRPKFMTSMWTSNVDFKGFDDRIFSFAKEKGYDLVLTVNSFEDEDYIFGSNQYYGGYGYLGRSTLFGKKHAVFTRIATTLYNPETREKIANSWDTNSEPAGELSKDVSSLTGDDLVDKKEVISSLIKNSLEEQLQKLNLL